MPHKNLIYSICIKYTYNQEDIEDNYLEALANFFKYMDSYDPARPVKTWIYAVTKRLVADLNNRNRNRMPPDDNIDISEISSSLSDEDEPSGNCMGMDNYREFYNDDILWALDRLKPIYREAPVSYTHLTAPVPFGTRLAGYLRNQILIFLYRQFHIKGIAAVQGLKFKNAS